MIVIKNISVIPMTSETILNNQNIIINNGKIKSIQSSNEKLPELSDNDVQIDATGKYLIPGLMDMHSHQSLNYIQGMLLANGVTTIRNMWGYPKILEWKEKVKKGEMIGPYIYTTGALTDGEPYWPTCTLIKTPEKAVEVVDECVSMGYDYVKNLATIPREAFLKLMEEASKKNIKVIGHGDKFVSYDELVELGYYSIEHTNMVSGDEKEISKLAKANMWFCPTLIAMKFINDYIYHGYLKKDITKIEHSEYVMSPIMEGWIQQANQLENDESNYNRDVDMDREYNKVRLFKKYSDRIIVGTDTPTPSVIPGFAVHEEMKLLVDNCGFSNYEAIKAATVNPANSLGIGESKGMIKENMDADMIILNDNPLDNISNTLKIYGVIQGGRYLDRKSLDDLLEKMKNLKEEELVSL